MRLPLIVMRLPLIVAIASAIVFQPWTERTMGAEDSEVNFKIVGRNPEAGRYRSCRTMIVGPWLNQPEEYEGYNGFVGWAGVTRLRSGRWLLAFTSGVWHVTVPWTEEIRKDPACRKQFEAWQKVGLPDIRAPRGGRCHIMHSDDQGLTWSKPETLIDTPDDDRCPTILELDDGTLLCTFFTYALPEIVYAKYMLSRDGGKTWTEPMDVPGKPEGTAFGNGTAIQLSDGAIVWVLQGWFDPAHPHRHVAACRSTDRGKTFEVASVVKSDHDLIGEPTVAQLPDGRLVMAIRREGDMCWSDDGGRTWKLSNSTGWDLFDPHLLQMPNGVLALFHGSYQTGALRVLLSPDGGHTWHGPGAGEKSGKPHGYSVDPSVYGYCHPMLLPDGTVYVVYLHTGGHGPQDSRTEALWGLRVRIHDDASGIDILPAPGSPAAKGRPNAGPEDAKFDGGDPELGNLQ